VYRYGVPPTHYASYKLLCIPMHDLSMLWQPYSTMDLIPQLWDYHIKATGICSRRFFLMWPLEHQIESVITQNIAIPSYTDCQNRNLSQKTWPPKILSSLLTPHRPIVLVCDILILSTSCPDVRKFEFAIFVLIKGLSDRIRLQKWPIRPKVLPSGPIL